MQEVKAYAEFSPSLSDTLYFGWTCLISGIRRVNIRMRRDSHQLTPTYNVKLLWLSVTRSQVFLGMEASIV